MPLTFNTPKLLLTAAALFSIALSAACSDPPAEQQPPVDECAAGDKGCVCKDDNTCNGDLVCFNAICVTEDDVPDPNPDPNPDGNPDPNPDANPDPNPDANPDPNPDIDPFEGLGLAVSAGTSRACEVVLNDPEKKIAEVTFDGDQLKGRSLRRGARLAIAFHTLDDVAIGDGAVSFVASEGAQDLEGIEITVGQCFDVQGQPIADASVLLLQP